MTQKLTPCIYRYFYLFLFSQFPDRTYIALEVTKYHSVNFTFGAKIVEPLPGYMGHGLVAVEFGGQKPPKMRYNTVAL